jgi:hypothetical protein
MRKQGIYSKFIELIRQVLFCDGFADKARFECDDRSFIRNRCLPLPYLCLIILGNIRKALQLEIDDFFKIWNKKVVPVSKQAFSKARTDLNPSAIILFFSLITRKMCKVKDLEYYIGRYRLCAIDGSDIALNGSDELREEYGCVGGSAKAVNALASFAFDPLNNIILDGSLNPSGSSERDCAKRHIDKISELPRRCRIKNLFLMDRGYPSREFLVWLMREKHKFLIRVKRKLKLEFDSVKHDENVSFVWENRTYRVRVLKITLDTGEIETLVTNLAQDELPHEEAGNLYFARWSIETKFNSLKNKLELENMSGRRVVTVEQDFWATLFLANLFASLEWETNAIIEESTANSDNKHQKTTNENRLISKARDQFIECLLEPSPSKRDKMFTDLVDDISRRPVEVKPGRSSKRSTPRKARFYDTYKSVT